MRIVIVILLYLILVFRYSRLDNPRHMTNDYDYGHFSRITSTNKWFFPQLLLTNPYEFTLSTNECLWIPKGWWHWIVSSPDTMALSYWGPVSNVATSIPFKYTLESSNVYLDVKNIIEAHSNIIEVWDSKLNELNYNHTKRDDACIITIDGYSPSNSFLREKLQDYFKISPIRCWDGLEDDIIGNVWSTLGSHDTGLHYDDYDGVLRVLHGTKHIKLYPPSQGHLLSPICTIPLWAKQTPKLVEYNLNNYIDEELDSQTNLPSARILYESMTHNRKVIREITKRFKSGISYVWGCKWQNGVMRWEVYKYHFGYHSVPVNEENLAITSTDLFDTSNPVGPDTHKYYGIKDQTYSLPFQGYGTGQGDKHESYYIIDESTSFLINSREYMKRIQVVHDITHFLYKYSCVQLCVFNKNPDEIFVMYLGISIDDFIHFLLENKYPGTLTSHVIENKNKYSRIKHEIAIIYNIKSGEIVRTALYGNF